MVRDLFGLMVGTVVLGEATCVRGAVGWLIAPHLRAVMSAVLAVVGTVCIWPVNAQAQITFPYDWNNPSGGAYENPLNWTKVIGTVPDSSTDIARFQLDSSYTVTVDNDYTVHSLVARQSTNATLAFTPPGTFGTPKVYSTGSLSLDPTAPAAIVELTMNAGDVRVSGGTFVGGATSSGAANLRVNSELSTASLNVGEGVDTTGRVFIGDESSLSSSGPLTLGDAGDALLELQAGIDRVCLGFCGPYFATQATANHASVIIGDESTSNSVASIRGIWTTGDLVVGNRGAAVIDLLATSTLTGTFIFVTSAGRATSNHVTVGVEPGSSGTVNVTGFAAPGTPIASRWDINGSLVLGGSGSAAGGTGRLAIGTENTVSVGELFKMWSGGTLAQAAGGTFTISGAAMLDGTLEFSATSPQLGNSFQVLQAVGGVTGAFDQLVLPALASGLAWDLDYNDTDVVLSVVAGGIAGDYNQNGIVDAADYVVWRNNLGSGTSLPNDNTPGVGQDDYARWKTRFGQSAGSGAAGSSSALAPVPEPKSLSLVAFAFAVMLLTGMQPRRAIRTPFC